ncbi:DEAD/DEAH box helicase family protein [Stenotrophomonas sp. W1S232]|uniref:DEAD/DEAH box helicase family protein n=1 Tax=Stenotrophomonas koreensis TaxID=266128 RepID=A0A7W3YV16_9GAMM|nr:DEAD/DEAH box helicase family protein [Stenotrophomonas koreensis]MBB1116687.1 DEAD/DEAH box helicase family protein [Stenotrophomonas koreensis]
MTAPKSLIINTPFEAPRFHWVDKNGALALQAGRRPAGYEVFDPRNHTRRTETLTLANTIRERVGQWREANYPGVTTVTRSLLEHWHDASARTHAFYFCQLEAIETLIWWVEAAAEYKQGIAVPGDGGAWERLCNKMATGTGKTTVMAMLITWQVLNALTYPKRNKEFSRAIFIVAPGLTVRERLQVLHPSHPENYYDSFNLCPSEALRNRLNQVELLIENWHSLMPLKQAERSVVKKGAESDKAFVRRVLGKLAGYKNLVVINDEAHHAYRIAASDKRDRETKRRADEMGLDMAEATRWIEGLDRIHKELGIQRCFDLSATPFAPTGRANSEGGLFDWIVSDFGLNDAIEAGLVKTPRVVVRDGIVPDTQTLRPKLYHLYRQPEVEQDLNRRGAQPHEDLPPLVQQAYTLLGADWRQAAEEWKSSGHTSPPVMLTVCNRTETASRIEHFFTQGHVHWPELRAANRTLRVDSRVLEKAEVGEKATADKDYEARLAAIIDAAAIPSDRKETLRALPKEELLRAIVDNVGKRGAAGQDIQNVISVAMLSEGWDAKNVTHIMGLRAFSSQLLCEQVIGRGLRRVGYDTEPVICPDGVERQLFRPEYVNVFGVPLSVFQDMGDEGEPPPPPKPSTQIEALPERNDLEIRWPNVVRVDVTVRPFLKLDWDKVQPLVLDPSQTPLRAELAPALGGANAWDKITAIDLELLPDEFRLQRLIFKAAQGVYAHLRENFSGSSEFLAFQLIKLIEQFLESDKLEVPSLFHQDPRRKRLLIALNMSLVVQHLLRYLFEQNQERIEPVFDEIYPIGSTREARTWYTTKTCLPTQKSQISHVVADSAWEAHTANLLESSEKVQSYVKNERLGYQIYYMWGGAKRRYVPDFLIRLANGKTLVLEIKGEDSPQNKAKRSALDAWVKAINSKGGFGVWCWDVAFEMSRIHDILEHHCPGDGKA